MSDTPLSPGVLAEDLRALADTVPFDEATTRLLEQAADALDPPDRADLCGHQATRRTADAVGYFSCDLPVDHEPWHHHQQSGGLMWDNDGRFL